MHNLYSPALVSISGDRHRQAALGGEHALEVITQVSCPLCGTIAHGAGWYASLVVMRRLEYALLRAIKFILVLESTNPNRQANVEEAEGHRTMASVVSFQKYAGHHEEATLLLR